MEAINLGDLLHAGRPSIPPCPPPHCGVHPWILCAANHCRWAGISATEAERLILQRMTRRPSPVDEVEVAVAKAYGTQQVGSSTQTPTSPRPIPLSELRFDPAKLKNFAQRIVIPADWELWLRERSPVRTDTQTAFSFLQQLYSPGESILVFDTMNSKQPLRRLPISEGMDCSVSGQIAMGGRYGRGIWWLCNPVDGRYHPNPRQNNELSCRSAESVTSFRYGVLESDEAPSDLWLGLIVQLPIRIAAIYSSGGRSIHTLVRVDAATKADWDGHFMPLKRQLKILGADTACLTAVRLTRLPQCRRPETKGFQKLLYLSPTPAGLPLFHFPVVRSPNQAYAGATPLS